MMMSSLGVMRIEREEGRSLHRYDFDYLSILKNRLCLRTTVMPANEDAAGAWSL